MFQSRSVFIWRSSCNILVKCVDTLCLCLRSLPEAKIKRFILTELIKKSQITEQRFGSLVKSYEEHFLTTTAIVERKNRKHVSSSKGALGSRMELNPVF